MSSWFGKVWKVCLVVAVWGLSPHGVVNAQLRLSEILPRDQAVYGDEDNDHTGWIEVMNPGPGSVNLNGYGLSDDVTKPLKWRFPSMTLNAGAHLVVFTSAKNRTVPPTISQTITDPPLSFTPKSVSGLRWWVDAQDGSSLVLTNGRVLAWRDKSGVKLTNVIAGPLNPSGVSGKLLWLDGADSAAFELRSGNVVRWLDKSGRGIHATQSTNARQPRLIARSGNTPSMVRFDGTDDLLHFERQTTIRTVIWVGREYSSVAGVVRPLLGDREYFDFARGNSGEILGSFFGMSTVHARAYLNGEKVDPHSTVLPVGSGRPLTGVTLVNSIDAVAGNLASERGLSFLGREKIWHGDVAEVILFDRELSDAERTGIESYLRAKWATPTPANLPIEFHATQAESYAQPVSVRDAVTGLPAVRFDGDDDVLDIPEISTARTVFWVCAENEYATDSYRPMLGNHYGTSFLPGGDRKMLYQDEIPMWVNGQRVNGVRTKRPTGRSLVTMRNPEPMIVSNIAADRPGNVDTHDRYWHGDMMEVLIYDRALSDEERVRVENYLMRKWFAPARNLHTNFEIHTNATAVILSRPDGSVLDQSPALVTATDVSIGRVPGTTTWSWYGAPTPGLLNTSPAFARGVSPTPQLSPEPGFHTNAVSVSVVNKDLPAGAIIEYTLTSSDTIPTRWAGSDPGASNTNTMIYTKPIVLEEPAGFLEARILRIRTRAPGYVPSAVVNATYMVLTNGLFQYLGNIPVVSLTIGWSNLLDETIGIYKPGPEVNPDGTPLAKNYDRDWERPAHIELIEPDGKRGFSQAAGLRIHGSNSRRFSQKSFRVHFRDRYGAGTLKYPVFPGNPVERFKVLQLRNGGNDWGGTLFRDALAHQLGGEIGLSHQDWRPATVFINGQFWGVYEIRERPDASHFAAHSGVAASDIEAIKDEFDVVAGDPVNYLQMAQFFRESDLSQPAKYEESKAFVDIDAYIDWLAMELYCDNGDWPGNNILAWRNRTVNGPWKWAMFDVDAGFTPPSLYASWQVDRIETVFNRLDLSDAPGPPGLSLLYPRGFARNAAWRARFLNRFCDLLNTTLLPARVEGHIDRFEKLLSPVIFPQAARWAGPARSAGFDAIDSPEEWTNNIGVVRQFVRNRPSEVRRQLIRMSSTFGLEGTARVTVEPVDFTATAGVRVNTVQLGAGQFPWSGEYFRGVPLEVEAKAQLGYRFVGWQGRPETSPNLVVTPTGDVRLVPLFVEDETVDVSRVQPAPFDLRSAAYEFNHWAPSSSASSYPPSMWYVMAAGRDPGLEAPLEGVWTGRYDLTERSRVRGLGENGVAFLNTSDAQAGGYPVGALLSLHTRSVKEIDVSWTGGTVTPNSRIYALRLQWRVGTNGAFADVVNAQGSPVQYLRSATAGHEQRIGPVRLPAAAENKAVVQLLWRYYALDGNETGPRAELRLDGIRVAGTVAQVQPSIELTRPDIRGQFLMNFAGTAGRTYQLQSSSDLVRWEPLETMVAGATGGLQFVENANSFRHQFFRIVRLN